MQRRHLASIKSLAGIVLLEAIVLDLLALVTRLLLSIVAVHGLGGDLIET
jgi:hypothetical protein